MVSAHRTPRASMIMPIRARARVKVIIAGAGGAAHLPGMTASMTSLPVLGVPVESQALKGMDSLPPIVRCPPACPSVLGDRQSGAVNAALLASAILANGDAGLADRLDAWREKQTGSVAEAPE